MKKILNFIFLCLFAYGSEEYIKYNAALRSSIIIVKSTYACISNLCKDYEEKNYYISLQTVEYWISLIEKVKGDNETLFYSFNYNDFINNKEKATLKRNYNILIKELEKLNPIFDELKIIAATYAENNSYQLDNLNPKSLAYKKLKEDFLNLNISKENKQKILSKLDLIEKNPEDTNLKKQLEYILNMPWCKSADICTDLQLINEKLEANHSGLKEIKDQILDYIAVVTNKGQQNAPIICLVGAPGTGKTSIAESIADALNLPFERISMAGIHDEAEIRGFNPTYSSARPGRFIQILNSSEVNNPVILIDEIDKISPLGLHGDPKGALLELLDPTQNNNFRDNFLELGFNFSKVIFITTANNLNDIPEALINRMLIINLNSYSIKEKLDIAKKHLIKRITDQVGLTDFLFSDQIIKKIITEYTYEGGVRQLEKMIRVICSRLIRERMLNNYKTSLAESELKNYLGESILPSIKKSSGAKIGCINGLYAGLYIGGTLELEALYYQNKNQNNGQIIYTGEQGEVVKESINVARSCLISKAKKFKIDANLIKESDIHFNIIADSKVDGPSAGAAFFTLLFSIFTNKPIDQTVAISGKIDLQGNMLAIGGVREKISGAERNGMKKVILPEENRADYLKIKDEVSIEVVFVKTISEVLDILIV